MSDTYSTTSPDPDRVPRPQRWAQENFGNRDPSRGRFTWFLLGIALLLALTWFIPYFVERVRYAATRGKLKAELEAAEEGLKSFDLDSMSRAFQLVSKRVAPSVANIQVVSVVEVEPRDDLSALFGGPRLRQRQGQGSGVVVDANGYILTNYHVVRGATAIEVSLADGRVLRAREVGVDSLTDLALLKVDATDLDPAEWGDSDGVEVGALVWAVGSPYGLQHSITAGIVSGKNRPEISGSVYYDFLQTDAAVNPGNSGGPLVDTHGRVIGINTAILGDAFQGISFAIPSNEARGIFEKLRQQGNVARGWLGVEPYDVTPALASQLGYEGTQGVLLRTVAPGSPAEQAGLRGGDIIMKWDSHEVTNATTFMRLVARTKIAAICDVAVWRRGERLNLKVTVGQRPSDTK